MKTEGLTFIEAVQALKDGRCEGFRRKGWQKDSVLGFKCGIEQIEFADGTTYIPYAIDFQYADYELVNPRRRKETRTLEGWVNVYENKQKLSAFHTSKDEAINGAWGETVACVHVTGTYEVEIDE